MGVPGRAGACVPGRPAPLIGAHIQSPHRGPVTETSSAVIRAHADGHDMAKPALMGRTLELLAHMGVVKVGPARAAA